MGTNYYMINKKIKETIDKEYSRENCMEDLNPLLVDKNSFHLGKSSAGWKILLRSNPFMANCFKAWKYILRQGKYEIYDEYGRNIEIEDFIELVEYKQANPQNKSHKGLGFDLDIDDEGYEFDISNFC